MARVQQRARADSGFLGAFTPYPAPPRGARRDPPNQVLPVVVDNQVASAVLRLPNPRLHQSVLLAGAAPLPTLHPDARPRSSQEETWIREMLWYGGHNAIGGSAHGQQFGKGGIKGGGNSLGKGMGRKGKP